jgi:hypothetical protein
VIKVRDLRKSFGCHRDPASQDAGVTEINVTDLAVI